MIRNQELQLRCKVSPAMPCPIFTWDILTTLSARSSFPSRSMRRKVGEIGSAAAKSSVHELQTTKKSIQLKKFLESAAARCGQST